MQTENKSYTLQEDGWKVRIQPPAEKSAARSMLLLHGWTGDETVMWIFTAKLPSNYWLFAPRGQVESGGGGYGWLPHTGSLPMLDDFTRPARDLIDAFQQWSEDTGAPQSPVDVMGFSQGAAMAYALAAFYPDRIGRVIALAGFLPEVDALPGRYDALRGKHVYIAHGTRDETVPVERSQTAVRVLGEAGADITYCESDVGHKLSADCLRGLAEFMRSE